MSHTPVTLYDSVDLSQIPPNAQAVAGYVGGRWPTYHLLGQRFPHAIHLSVAVSSTEDAAALDVEAGDCPPSKAPAWLLRQHARGVGRPVIYASVSQWPALLELLRRAGVGRSTYRIWTAHYGRGEHRCSARCWPRFHDNAGATQYTDRALGRNLDASLVFDRSFFP